MAANHRQSGSQLKTVAAIVALILSNTACNLSASKPSHPAASEAHDDPSKAKPAAKSLRIAIALDAAPAFKEVAEAYERSSGVHVEVVSGLSIELANDIEKRGLIFDAYASPKPDEIDRLIASHFCEREPTVIYGQQRIALWTKPGVEPPKQLSDLADPKWGTIVMTIKSPYGRIAKAVLMRHGVWEAVAPKILDAQGMYDFEKQASKGDVGITALSVAIRLPGNYVEVDPSEFPQVIEQIITCKGAHAAPNEPAKDFLAFVASTPSRATLRRAGFY